MSAMKKLQPEMTRIREQAGDDKMRMQKEMMELYKKEKEPDVRLSADPGSDPGLLRSL